MMWEENSADDMVSCCLCVSGLINIYFLSAFITNIHVFVAMFCYCCNDIHFIVHATPKGCKNQRNPNA